MKVRTAGMALTVCLGIFLAPSSQGEASWSLWSEEELASKVRQAAPIGLALELLGLEPVRNFLESTESLVTRYPRARDSRGGHVDGREPGALRAQRLKI
jgi:hypothetical protein